MAHNFYQNLIHFGRISDLLPFLMHHALHGIYSHNFDLQLAHKPDLLPSE